MNMEATVLVFHKFAARDVCCRILNFEERKLVRYLGHI